VVEEEEEKNEVVLNNSIGSSGSGSCRSSSGRQSRVSNMCINWKRVIWMANFV